MKIENINTVRNLLGQLHDRETLYLRLKNSSCVSISDIRRNSIVLIPFEENKLEMYDDYNKGMVPLDSVSIAKQFIEALIILLETEIQEIKSALETL